MSKRKKFFIGIGGLGFLGLVIILNLIRKEKGIEVKGIVAKKDNIVSRVQADGILKGIVQVEIGSDVMGKIVKMKVKEGDKVYEGDTLCIIDQDTYISRVRRASAALRLAKLRFKKAKIDLNRTTKLFKEKLISSQEYETIKIAYETALSELKSAKESYNEANLMLKKTVITSPTGGEVIQINKEEGEMVIPGTVGISGSVIMTIADREKMCVRALVDETEIVKIELNQEVEVKVDAFPDTIFTGKVIKIGGIPEHSNVRIEGGINYPVEIEIEGRETKLYPGMSATCEIKVGAKDSVIVIPYRALGKKKIKEEERDIVILAKEGKSIITPVKIGLTGEEGVEIKEGIRLGDTVLTGPYRKLKDMKDSTKVEVKITEEEDEE